MKLGRSHLRFSRCQTIACMFELATSCHFVPRISKADILPYPYIFYCSAPLRGVCKRRISVSGKKNCDGKDINYYFHCMRSRRISLSSPLYPPGGVAPKARAVHRSLWWFRVSFCFRIYILFFLGPRLERIFSETVPSRIFV